MPVIRRNVTEPKHDGFLVPPWYVEPGIDDLDMNIASLIWGFSIGLAVFCAFKATWQSMRSWHAVHRVTIYVILVWGQWLSNVAMAALGWLNLRGILPSSFWLWFTIVFLWCFQVQFLMQIILNRISLLILVKENATKLKWIVFLILLILNISVFIVWIPARLQISQEWIRLNNYWDRTQKGLFLVIDASLNYYFVYLVKARLIADGLDKYIPLFRFNLAMMGLSISLDAVLIGLMSLRAKTVYIEFQCLSYLAKLYIEMNMADLIRKIVKEAQNPQNFSGTTCVTNKTRPLSAFSNMMSPTWKARFSHLRRDTLVAGGETYFGGHGITGPPGSCTKEAPPSPGVPSKREQGGGRGEEEEEADVEITRAASVHLPRPSWAGDSPQPRTPNTDGAEGVASLKGNDTGSRGGDIGQLNIGRHERPR